MTANLLRLLDAPARHAVHDHVGGRPKQTELRSRTTTPLVRVQGKHAHAWPEIYFDGVGWVPFEPTPGRANPAAVQSTGIEAGS